MVFSSLVAVGRRGKHIEHWSYEPRVTSSNPSPRERNHSWERNPGTVHSTYFLLLKHVNDTGTYSVPVQCLTESIGLNVMYARIYIIYNIYVIDVYLNQREFFVYYIHDTSYNIYIYICVCLNCVNFIISYLS